MRYVVLGAGAIGGAIGGKLAVAGHDVVLVARGPHLEALRRDGLELRDPDETVRLDIPAVASPAEAAMGPGDCVIVATKTQQTAVALDSLRVGLGEGAGSVPVVCAQNGVENERIAARCFDHVYGMRVMVAGTHLVPGVVEIGTAPVFGILDVGRYPRGCDSLARTLAEALGMSGFDAAAVDDVMPLKYLKLLGNLGNALQAATGTRHGSQAAEAVLGAARAEARACYEAAGIAVAEPELDSPRHESRGNLRSVGGSTRSGGSSWQSLQRGTGDIEADYLNGEIALLGRLYGVATPVNSYLQRLANRLARDGSPPGSVSVEQVVSDLEGVVDLPV